MKEQRPPVRLDHLLTPNKIVPVYLRRTDRCDTLPPYSVELHLTTTCNYRCRHCSYERRNQDRRQVAGPIIDRLIGELTTTLRPSGVYFSGGGEPTTLKHWDSHITRFTRAGIDTALVTNGSLITDVHLEALGGLGYIAVSIYSPDPETYAAITGGVAFAAQFELPGKLRRAGYATVVGARCVLNSLNYNAVGAILEGALTAGYDYLIFIPEIDYERRGVTLSRDEVDALKRQVAAMTVDPAKTNLASLCARDFGYYAPPAQEPPKGPCQAVRLRTNAFVNYDGGVYLCQPDIGNPQWCIGNLNEQPFSSLWNAPRHRNCLQRLHERFGRGECTNCRAIALNRAIAAFEAAGPNEPLVIVKDSFL